MLATIFTRIYCNKYGPSQETSTGEREREREELIFLNSSVVLFVPLIMPTSNLL